MLEFNVNGTIHRNTDTCKLFNLSAQELHALDVYIMTDNVDAQNWILSPNPNGSAKISIEFDKSPGNETMFEIPGQAFPLAGGLPGESFSNPAIYRRADRIVAEHTRWVDVMGPTYWTQSPGLPYDNSSYQSYNSTSHPFITLYSTSINQFPANRYSRIRIYTALADAWSTVQNYSSALPNTASGTSIHLHDGILDFPLVDPLGVPLVDNIYSVNLFSSSDTKPFFITGIELLETVPEGIFDDEAHIQKLPTHNAIPQEPVRMLGGTNNTSVATEWGKVRAAAPLFPEPPMAAPIELSPEEQAKWLAERTFDEAAFYNERSEWYINMATRDDFLRVDLVQDIQTNQAEVDLYMKDIVIIIQPSQHLRLKKNYMYYDIDNEPPRLEPTGVTY